MAENTLNKISQKISVKSSDEEIVEQLEDVLLDLETVYSYLVYAKYKDEQLMGWLIEYNVSQIDEYNTLVAEDIIYEILAQIKNSKEKKVANVIGYKQPSLELMLKLYDSLVKKLSLKQSERWTELEYEDAYQMCQYTMLKLYRKNYYIHKRLLERAYENDVLLFLRRNKDKPDTVSIDQIVYDAGDDNEKLTIADMLPDTKAIEEQEDIEDQEVFNAIFAEVKDIIVELVGERQFEQLLRDYGQKHTTAWSRKKMQQIKEHLKKLGITWKSFNRRYV